MLILFYVQIHPRGAVVKVKVLGCIALIDEGKLFLLDLTCQGI